MAPDVEELGQPPRPLSLLSLPPHIRHLIYLRTGVARFDGHPYTYYLDGRKESRTVVSGFDPPPARNFAGLLLSCRTLHAETAALLYSANRFVIFYSLQGSLKPLHALSPTALASLTSLKIILNESSCHQPTDSYDCPPYPCCRERKWTDISSCVEYHSNVHRRPLLDSALDLDLTSAKLATQAMLSEWYDTAAYLSSRVGVGRLELSLVCDVDPEHQYSPEVGRLAVAPITLFPRLRNCHIRLGKTPDRSLQRLAEGAVLQACHASHPFPRPTKIPSESALTNLPFELRRRILEHTDLITPWKEVTLSRQARGYQVFRPPCTDGEGGCPPHIHHGCRLSECSSRPGCFCRRQHAAFTFTCNCWAPPIALFLVCRALCRDAQSVFFSGNRFIVHDFHAMMPWELPSAQFEPLPDPASTAGTTSAVRYYPYERLLASEFLTDIIPAHCLAHLRFLELVFPPYVPHGWPRSERAATLDWRDTANWIRGKVNAPALTIRLAMVDFRGGSYGRKNLTKEQGIQIIKGYSGIFEFLIPLIKEDGLAGFHIQAAYPWRWTQDVIRRMQWDDSWLAGAEQNVTETAMEFIWGKGDPRLDLARTKPEPRESGWRRWYELDFYCSIGA